MNLTRDDVKRVIWTFIQAAFAVVIAGVIGLLRDSVAFDWEVVGIAALAAGASAVKNLFTDPGDTLK